MKRKPSGAKYRNLTTRGGTIYYQRRVGGKRIRFSCNTNDWQEAAAVARLYEERRGIGRLPFATVEVPTFRDFTKRYLEEDTSHLATTTQKDRRSYLREERHLMSTFGDLKLDEIGVPELRLWWNQHVVGAGLSSKTGRIYLDVVASILGYACVLEILERNPVPAFRETLRRRSGTKRAREETASERRVRPIERAGELEALVREAQAEGLAAHVLVLLCLDAGLRVGEALGLSWGAIEWGDDRDRTRALRIEGNRPRGGKLTSPKSGRSRRVALSRRLRWALLELYQASDPHPGVEAFVLEGVEPANFRNREWRRILKRAGIGHRALKDLRDTFASQLLTAGVQLGYVSAQLGHADVAVTARHYARWIEDDHYREPMQIEPGEVPADLLARLSDPNVTPLDEAAEGVELGNLRSLQAIPGGRGRARIGDLPAQGPKVERGGR
jgi:integrase